MARFNSNQLKQLVTQKTKNFAGGEAYLQDEKLEFASILLTSFVQDQFYRSSKDTTQRIAELIQKMEDKQFVAKCAIYVRNQFGMRSVSHVTAGTLLPLIRGNTWAAPFYNQVVRRVDDMAEVLGVYLSQHGTVKVKKGKQYLQPIPNAMKKGFRQAFNKFDNYQLAKYRMEGKAISLIDLVNLVHPIPKEHNREALSKLVQGKLNLEGQTRQDRMTRIGQTAKTAEEKATMKADAYAELLNTGKYPYFDLLRNLRNMIQDAPELVEKVCELLTQEPLIQKSLVLPFRFQTALHELEKLSGPEVKRVIQALSKAVDLSMVNVPSFEGSTLVVVDTSGSMTRFTDKGRYNPKVPVNTAALFAAMMAKANQGDMMIFASDAQYLNINTSDSTLAVVEQMRSQIGTVGHGTDFHKIFQTANRPYDRIFIFSDMQGWIGGRTPNKAFAKYCQRTGANPFVYNIDLTAYGTLQFPQRKVFCLAGFSGEIFKIMEKLEADPSALIHEIENSVSL